MAQKKPESNPNHSSSSEEEEDEEVEEEATGSEDSQSESQEVSDSDSGQNKLTPDQKTSISQTPSKPTNNLQNRDQNLSESEEESGSDTDSDDSPPKTAGAGKVVPAKPISVKRPAAAPEKVPVPEVKKAKKDGSGDDDCKKQLFQRLWSEDDEIVILKGMIDYKKENGESPVNDMGAFHEFIKKSLHVDVSRAQLVDKVRRLKKKYVNNVLKEKNGKDRSFSKNHEQKGYELSKLIWGGGTESKTKAVSKNDGGGVVVVVKGNVASGSNCFVKLNGGVDGKGDGVVKVGMDVNRFVRYGSNEGPVLVEEVVKGGMELVEGSKLKELEDKWKELKRQELLLCVKRMDLFKEQALVVIDAVNSFEN